MSTITLQQRQSITEFLETHTLVRGIGKKENTCSIAAINLSLSGRLTDEVPMCMSDVIGRWIIVVQDSMPFEMRNSDEWKRLLPFAAGTGRDKENERLKLILNWMWTTVLPSLQSFADKLGFGEMWAEMCVKKTASAANDVDTAITLCHHTAMAAFMTLNATRIAVYATRAAADAARAAACSVHAADAADAAATCAAHVADAAATCAVHVVAAGSYITAIENTDINITPTVHAAARADKWHQINPCQLLQQLIEV
jgi:hypothetical protein